MVAHRLHFLPIDELMERLTAFTFCSTTAPNPVLHESTCNVTSLLTSWNTRHGFDTSIFFIMLKDSACSVDHLQWAIFFINPLKDAMISDTFGKNFAT